MRCSTVCDVMTREVVAVPSGRPFKEVARTLDRHRIAALPVVADEGRPVGVVAETDLLRHEAGRGLLGLAPGRVRVRVDDGVVTPTGRIDAATDLPVIVRLCRSVAGVVAVRPRLTFAHDGADLDVEPPRTSAPRAGTNAGTNAGRKQT